VAILGARQSLYQWALEDATQTEALHHLAALGGAMRRPRSHPYLCRYERSLRPSLASVESHPVSGSSF